jgi:hypothetical protein
MKFHHRTLWLGKG